MNIFWLDNDITLSAQYHCDKHVVKMCVEYAQLLSSVVRLRYAEICTDEFPYRLTHKNHPCAIWARESWSNYMQLRKLAFALGDEFTARYGKQHKSIELVKRLPTDPIFNNIALTEPPQCMPEQYRGPDLVEAYRKYYLNDKAAIATWKTQAPPWWKWNTQ